ncbi:MAG: alpha/beta fold hydrolase [Lachnospiraceae bacterium]|nr:alpha/beta fold hydrolase [Lachnospiraceae bacterium]
MMYTNDQQLFYGDNGIGIVLIHGVTSGCAQMVPMGRMLQDYGYSVHCVNIAGHGTYPGELLRTSWEDAVDKAWYDYDQMKANYDKVYIGGLSMGGCLSLALAARRDDIDGVISISSPLYLDPGCFIAGEYPAEQTYFHRAMTGKEGTARRYHIHYEDIPIKVFGELKGLISYLNIPGVLEKVDCPVFIAQALDDQIAQPASGKKIFDRISSTDKYLYEVPTAGHNMPMNEGRFGLVQSIVAWLDRMDGILS